jgi:hypothetical protein
LAGKHQAIASAMDTDTVGLIVVIVAVAVVLIADKLRQQGQKKDPPA